MKKFLLSIIILFAVCSLNKSTAQCTPDVTIKNSGIFPSALENANINVAYNQVIQFFIAKDTVVNYLGNDLNAIIDTIFITGVAGLPPGFNYACNNSGCYSLGGQAGCVALTGTAAAGTEGNYPLKVYLKIKARIFLGPVPVGQTVLDSNSRYSITINGTNSIAKNALENNWKVYQTNGKLNIYAANQTGKLNNCELTTILGKVVANFSNFSLNQNNEFATNLDGFAKGIYVLNLDTNEGRISKKIIVE